MTSHPSTGWDFLIALVTHLPSIIAAMAGVATVVFARHATHQNQVQLDKQDEQLQQGKEVLKATNGIQAAAIVVNRADAAAEAIMAERERVGAISEGPKRGDLIP